MYLLSSDVVGLLLLEILMEKCLQNILHSLNIDIKALTISTKESFYRSLV